MALLEVEIMQLGLSVGSLSAMRSPLLRVVTRLPADKLSFEISGRELSEIASETQAAALASISAVVDPALSEFNTLMEASSEKALSGVRTELRKAIKDLVFKDFF